MAYLTKSDILESIDSMTLYEGDYDVIINLINNCDDTLFVKIMEEIILGHLSFADFKPIFDDSGYSDIAVKSFGNQKAFHDIYVKYAAYLSSKGLVDAIGYDTLVSIDSNIVNMEKRNAIYSLFIRKTGSNLAELYKDSVIGTIIDNLASGDATKVAKANSDIDAFLLSADDYIVPIDYDHVELNDSDFLFAKENGLSETEVRKIKSLALYFGNLYQKKMI